MLPEGIEAGLIGGFTVVLVFLTHDLWDGEALHTPSVLGTLLVAGVEAVRAGPPVAGAAALYHVVHFFVWVALGFAGSATLAWSERRRALWPPPAAALLAVIALGGLDARLHGLGLERLHLMLGALAGLVAMGVFLAWRHPGAIRPIRSDD